MSENSASGKGRLEGEYTYTPNGCSPLHHDDACAHDGCEDDAEWQVDFLVDGDDIKNGHAAFPYCDDHVADYFGYHPDDPEIRTDGGVEGGSEREEFCHGCSRNFPESELTAIYTIRQGIEQKEWVCPDCERQARDDEKPPARTDGGSGVPDTVNGTPVEWRDNGHGVIKCWVEVPFGETRVLTVPRYIKNPFTDRRHDLTKLSDDGYLKPMLALLSATNSPDHIDIGSAPVLTFDEERFEYREMDGQHILVKREAETKFEEMVLETGDIEDTGNGRDD